MQKRRWFQIHLSTAIVLMFVAGALLWANVRNHAGRAYLLDGEKFGWPCDAAWRIVVYAYNGPSGGEDSDPFQLRWRLGGAAINLLVAMTILSAVSVGCEWIIRRRDGERHQETA